MADFRVPFALAMDAFGVDLVVTPPEGIPVPTRGVWDASPPVEEQPFGTDLYRREPRRVICLPRNVLTAVPRGSVIVAPEDAAGEPKTWTTDGPALTEYDCWRVIVKLAQS